MNHKLGHVAVRVKDMDRAVAYYMSLGFNCEWESDDLLNALLFKLMEKTK